MSDNRKILVAKRNAGNNNNPVKSVNTFSNKTRPNDLSRALKRPTSSSSSKNLANDRLKRLRADLNEEVVKKGQSSPLKPPNRPNLNKSFARNDHGTYNTRPNATVQGTYKTSMSIAGMNKANRHAAKRPQNVSNQSVLMTKVPRTVSSTQSVLFSPCTSASTATLSTDVNSEDMEWSTSDESPNRASIATTSQSIYCNVPIESTTSASYPDCFLVVVDTNVLLSNLQIVKNVVEANVAGYKKPVVYVPWIVIEELDFIKDDPRRGKLKWKAQEAVKYIERMLRGKNSRMMGQSLGDVNDQKYAGKSQDNKIVSCCLQVADKCRNMVLVTNDINLKNKAHLNNVPICSPEKVMEKVVQSLNSTKSQSIMERMTVLCKKIIWECAQNAYGPVYEKMEICQAIPNTLHDCIVIFSKYWFPVFEELLMKQVKTAIDELSSFLKNNTNVKDDSDEMTDLLKLCIRMCLFLKDVDCSRLTVESTIRELNAIKSS